MVPSSISRHPEINFFGPQESSYLSLGATSELKDTQTTACRVAFQIKSSIKRVVDAVVAEHFGHVVAQTPLKTSAFIDLRHLGPKSIKN